jgi:hypothetical protein
LLAATADCPSAHTWTNTYVGAQNEPFQLSILNSGLGPAIVTRSSVLIDGKEFEVGAVVDWPAFARFAPELPPEMQWTLMTTGTVVPPGSEVHIVKWPEQMESMR